MVVKPEGKSMSEAAVIRKTAQIAGDIAKFYGVPHLGVDIQVSDHIVAARVNTRSARGEMLPRPVLWVNPQVVERMGDKELGVADFRIAAHESAHLLSGNHNPLPGISHIVEEGGAEALSLFWWSKRAQPFNAEDAVRRNGKWTSTPKDSLAASLVYNDKFLETMRRSASDAGAWDRDKVMAKVLDVYRGDHTVRLAFRDRTKADFPLPAGVEASGDVDEAEALARWLVD
jgi:hypothetical protein